MSDLFLLSLKGVACGGCISNIEKVFEQSGLPLMAEFNLESRTLSVSGADLEDIIGLIEEAGYGAQLVE